MSSKRVKRVLLYRLGSLGDHLVALPCYRLVRRAFPDAECRLMTTVPINEKAAAAEAVLGGMGLVDGYLTHESGERNPLTLLHLAWQVIRWRPDVLVYLAGARGESIALRDRMFFRICGVWRQIGVPVTAEMQQERRVDAPAWALPGTPWYESEGKRLARCVAELGDARVENAASWGLDLKDGERAESARLVEELGAGDYFCFSLGTKVQANQWGLMRWMELLRWVAETWPGCGLAIVGAAEEGELSEAVAEIWRGVVGAGPVVNLCGLASPRVSAAVMERAKMFFGHDSGPAHLAAAVGTPVLGVFGARMLPGTWMPHGEHVRVVLHWVECGGCVIDTCIVQKKKCIMSIGVDEVKAAVRAHVAAMEGR